MLHPGGGGGPSALRPCNKPGGSQQGATCTQNSALPSPPWPQAPAWGERTTLTPSIFWKPGPGLLHFPAVPVGTHLGGVMAEKDISSETLTVVVPEQEGTRQGERSQEEVHFPGGQEGPRSSLNSKESKQTQVLK